MRHSLCFVVATALAAELTALLASAGVNDARAAGDAGTGSLPGCIQITASARYVPFGYNHVVDVKNGCSKVAACSIRTDVNPQPIAVEVAPGVTSEVVTFVASPSQTFTPNVTCVLE
jgi:hypothetical protein